MRLLETYVAFWAPHRRTIWGWMGHVEVFGYTEDETWVFLDPRQPVTDILVAHRYDDVTALLAHRFANCAEVWRFSEPGNLRLPLFGPHTCVSVAASICGVRAYSIAGLRRKLRSIGAVKVESDEGARGRPAG